MTERDWSCDEIGKRLSGSDIYCRTCQHQAHLGTVCMAANDLNPYEYCGCGASAGGRDWSLDTIGKRLSGEGLSEHEQLLAADDKVRVQWALGAVAGAGYTDILDIGASDGWLADWWARHGHRVFTIEQHEAHRERLSRLPVFAFHGDAWLGVVRFPRIDPLTVFCGEILEHMTAHESVSLVTSIMDCVHPRTLIVTVPNADCASYMPTARARRDWPDHRQQFTAEALASLLSQCCGPDNNYAVRIYPIVGTLDDSIWLGAVCRRN